jgi:hypothetical protein
MACCGCGGFNPTSCAQCCSQWTLPGGPADVPTEIQAAVSISPVQVCFGATRNFPFRFWQDTILDTLSHSGTYTLIRGTAAGRCARYSYSNCTGLESILVEAFLSFSSGKCVWDVNVRYERCIACNGPNFQPGQVYATSDNICCNGTSYGYKAVSSGVSSGLTSANVGMQPFTMTFACQTGAVSGSATVQRNPSGASGTWNSFCNRNGISCGVLLDCGAVDPVANCPNTSFDAISVTLTV